MTVFKTYFKVLNKCKVPIILYTVLLIIFGGLNVQTNDSGLSFQEEKPKIVVIQEEENQLTAHFVSYLEAHADVIEMEEDKIDDAIFYRDVSYAIFLPKNFENDWMQGTIKTIPIKASGDYRSSLAEMMVARYFKVLSIYQPYTTSKEELLEKLDKTLLQPTKVEIHSTLDTSKLTKVTIYYNFMNYSILAGTIYVICLVLYSFHEEKILRRTTISSMSIKHHNRILLRGNILFSLGMWIGYVLLGSILCGNIFTTANGIFYMLNSFLFMICAVTIAFFISNMINNKNAMNGIINVVAIGSSFLCGAFVPAEMLPKAVLNIAHILPSYWYINTNERLKTLETVSFDTMKPIIINMMMIFVFTVLFLLLSNIVSKKQRRKG